MCFSAPASFVAAAFTGLTGRAAIRRVQSRRELPLAAVPLVFAAQQAVEGMLWLTLPQGADGAASSLLTDAFLLVALVVWPVYAPLATWLVEPNEKRRLAIGGCLAIGLGVACYLLSMLFLGANSASISGGHIVYRSDPPPAAIIGPLYLLATGIAPALSSHRSITALAGIVLAGSVVAYVAYWEAFVSVWCFFAAAASLIVLAHFALPQRAAPAAAPRD